MAPQYFCPLRKTSQTALFTCKFYVNYFSYISQSIACLVDPPTCDP